MENTYPNGKPLALVTGASSGIGYELAVQFATHGYDLLIVSDTAAIFEAARRLEAMDAMVTPVQCDLAQYDGVEKLWQAALQTGKPVSAACINAGVGVGGSFAENELAEEIKMINLNVVSTVHLAKRLVQDMLRRGQGGRILFTSSVAATMPGPYLTAYSATKAFVQSFAEGLRYELQDSNITITAMQPGPTDTHFFAHAHMEDTKVGVMEKDEPEQVARQGFEALMKGEDTVLAGSLKTRISNAANDLIPEGVKAKKHAKIAKPGSAANG